MLPTPRRISDDQRFARAHLLRGRVGLGLVAALSVLSGMTDAIGFLETGDFVSFMSGNTTRLAVDALWASAAIAFLLGIAALKIPRRWQLNYMPR